MLDEVRRRRLRWRARRGLLENDLIVSRFLEAELDRLSEPEVLALDELLDLTDRDLLDLLLERRQPEGVAPSPQALAMLQRLRATRAPGA